MKGYVIITDGRYGDVYFTGGIGDKFWSNNINDAKIYRKSEKKKCEKIISGLLYNNPRIASVTLHELV